MGPNHQPNGRIVPSQYTWNAKAAKLDIIGWTIERSGRIVEEVLPTKGDIMVTLDVFARQSVLGVFSDWSGTVSYYASFMGLN